LGLLAFISSYGKNPTNSFVFNIVKKNDVIGSISITESRISSVIYNIKSKVEAKFILKFYVVGKEKYIYKNGTLIYASLFRMLNNVLNLNFYAQNKFMKI
jgi:hypothetical protein